MKRSRARPWPIVNLFMVCLVALAGCETVPLAPNVEPPTEYSYIIGPGDKIEMFVWGNPEVSRQVPVRPDGKISAPLVEELPASGKTPFQLAREVERELSKFIRNPLVSIIVNDFVSPYSEQVRVVGQAAKPQALPYKEGMSLLDLMILVGGVTDYAAGNRATIIRTVNGIHQQLRVRVDDLLEDGDITANVNVLPGDVLIIPEAYF